MSFPGYTRSPQITPPAPANPGNWVTTIGGSSYFTSGGSTIPISNDPSTLGTATTASSPHSDSDSIPSSRTGPQTTSSSDPHAPSSSTTDQTYSSSYAVTTTFFTTSTPLTTITESSMTVTSFSSYVVSTTIFAPAVSQTPLLAAQASPVCIGDGMDALSSGLIESIIIPSVIGLLLWLLFAIIRPRFREIYGLREWFPPQDLRPKPLSDKFWAFLFPHVPLVPSVPKDVSDAGRSPIADTELFPSDEQLSQRTLWMAFLIVLGWSIVGLAGALPLYLVSTSCLADSAPHAQYLGVYSVLQDLSLLRLLYYLDQEGSAVTTASALVKRATDGHELTNARIRIIILTILLIVLAVIPGVWKILKEFNRIVAYRQRWLKVRCAGMDMAWLSARKAPGFRGWGERRLKEFIVKSGLSSSMEVEDTNQRNGNRRRRNLSEVPLTRIEEESLEVDLQGLFSIGDTQSLALLIEERDEILENLEIAETKYISSFRLSTPDPSITDLQSVKEEDTQNGKKPYISRPLPLGAAAAQRRNSRRNRARNPAYGASSLTPTSYVAPSQYYKLGSLRGVSGDHGQDASRVYPSLSDSINQRVVGSRFQELNHRDSLPYGKLPLGSHVKLKSGELRRVETGMSEQTTIPDPSKYGPNHGVEEASSSWDNQTTQTSRTDTADPDNSTVNHYRGGLDINEDIGDITEERDDDWVDVMHEAPETFEFSPVTSPASTAALSPQGSGREVHDYFGLTTIPRRPRRNTETPPSERRETFPLRARSRAESAEQPPPHLRLQTRGPFVRPLSGLNHDNLGDIYADISRWRTQLKAINQEIAEAQRDAYNDIADGSRIKGWLLVGRGLRFIPGVQMIEGRAKEDVRWDELQNEMKYEGKMFVWIVIAVTVILLAASLTAVAGLALGSAPDFAYYFPFLRPLARSDDWVVGLAVCLVPAVAATLFIGLALAAVAYTAQACGAVSISGLEMITFKACFFVLTVVAAIWLMTIGAILFAMEAWTVGSGRTRTVADGAIYISFLALMLVLNVAIISPALLLLQPFRLLRIPKSEKNAITSRQRFRAVYPRTYNASFAMGCCILGLIFASTFSLIFPLIGPAVVILIFLTLIAHRYLIGYVYGRTRSQTGGLLQLWLLKRFGTLVAFQPFLMGLIFLTRRLWPEAGVLLGAALAVVLVVEGYAAWKTREPGLNSLGNITRDSLDTFAKTATTPRLDLDEESTSLVSSSNRNTRMRGSFASVLDMMSMTLAVAPALTRQRGPVPLPTETLDDLTATERAARTHPDAPPHLPILPFADHAQETSGVLYAPELLAPDPIIWLPNDSSGIARSEAKDLDKYHHLKCTLDVRAQEDVLLPRRLSVSR